MAEKRIFYQEDMADMQCPCGVPGCEDPLFLHSRCHIGEPTWVSYFDGILTVSCSVCESVIQKFAIAKRSEYGVVG